MGAREVNLSCLKLKGFWTIICMINLNHGGQRGEPIRFKVERFWNFVSGTLVLKPAGMDDGEGDITAKLDLFHHLRVRRLCHLRGSIEISKGTIYSRGTIQSRMSSPNIFETNLTAKYLLSIDLDDDIPLPHPCSVAGTSGLLSWGFNDNGSTMKG